MPSTKNIIVLVGGLPGAGKSTITKTLIKEGYTNHNRDKFGKSREEYNKRLEELILEGHTKLVLDNTYISKDMRTGPIQIAKKHGYRIECHWMDTDKYDAIYNACSRQVEQYGKILNNDELKATKSPNMFPINVIYQYDKKKEVPTTEEGFDVFKVIHFQRHSLPKDYKNRAIILDYDGTIRLSKSGNVAPNAQDDIIILPNRKKVLDKYREKGYQILGVSNQSGISKGYLSKETAISCFEETNKSLGIDIDYRFCEHPSVPVQCYCRKPNVGFAVEFIHKYKLDPKQCIFVGDMTSDKTFAKRSGFKFIHADDFFKCSR
jgi:HAD superfamily hydrolase (TIGR01662 family)